MDKMGYQVSKYYRHTSQLFTGDDGQSDVIGLRIKKYDVISNPSTFSCTAIEASLKNKASDGILHGMYVEIDYGDPIRNHDSTMRLVFELPNGDIIAHGFYTANYRNTNGRSINCEFIDFSHEWENILSQYHEIPAGIYKFYVYMDNTLLTTRNFTFK